MGLRAPQQKREREDAEPADDAQIKRLKALAALKAQAQNQPPAAQEEPEIKQPNGQASDSVPDGQHRNGSTNRADGTTDADGNGLVDEEAAQDEGDAWAEDHDARDVALFDADMGQDFDDQLNASEKHWEEQNFAQKLPPGWAKCPNSGTEIAGIFPTKAPFGGMPGQRVPPAYQWKPTDVVAHVRGAHGARVGTVIDLTMSRRYYKPNEFRDLGIQHIKIPCRGHGQVPEPRHVNQFVWEVRKAQKLAQDVWEKEKALLKQYDSDQKKYLEDTLPEFERKVAQGLLPPTANRPAEPLQKMPKQERALVEYRELVAKRPRVIVVHCTHGFNRSGYMLVHYLMRNNVMATVAQFTKARPPGIYKDEYIQGLFRYYRQARKESGPGAIETPLVPAWKPGDDSPENFVDGPDGPKLRDSDDEGEREMQHDDAVGEDIHEEEANMYREHVVSQLRAEFLRRRNPAGEDDGMTDKDLSKLRNYARRLEFPGSQPVSLSNDNQELLYKHRYWSTWKADGTRYMAYLCHSGMFLIDRRMRITRVHMRFPVGMRRPPVGMLAARDPAAWVAAFKGGTLTKPAPLDPAQLALHHMTLVEGEMVIDSVPGGGSERSFYVYDLMMIQGVLVTDLPWKRYMLMEEVTRPRVEEAACIRRGGWPHKYDYAAEPFRVQRKEFWPLHDHQQRQRHFFPTIRHENDGLILQAYDAKYIPDTCNMLLKWKPSSHNSVDFTLLPYTERVVQDSRDCVAAHTAGQQLFLGVWAEGRVVIAYDVDHDRLAAIGPDDSLKKALTTKPARVAFPGGEDPEQFHGMVIECNFDGDKHEWCFMRDRAKDKETPNALNTYLKVVKSIVSAIDERDIQEQFKLAYMLGKDKYAKDIAGQRAMAKQRPGSHTRR